MIKTIDNIFSQVVNNIIPPYDSIEYSDSLFDKLKAKIKSLSKD